MTIQKLHSINIKGAGLYTFVQDLRDETGCCIIFRRNKM